MLTGINYPSNNIVPDVVSAVITASGHSGTFTPSYGQAYAINLKISAVTGTTPSLTVAVQESNDGGVADWNTVYTFTTATAIGIQDTPAISMSGSVIRYQYTVSGTTPSFTVSINRTQLASSSAIIPTVYSNYTTSTLYRATTGGSGYGTNDLIEGVNEYNLTTGTPVFQNTTYHNITQGVVLSVAPNLSNLYPVLSGNVNTAVTTTDYSGTITTAGTAQQLLAVNSNRAGWVLVNKSNSIIYVNELTVATGGKGDYPVMPNESYPPFGSPITTTPISIFCNQTGAAFYCRSWNTPIQAGSTLSVAGSNVSGQSPANTSFPIVSATDYTESNPVMWVAAIAGTGYSRGDTLQQTIKSNGGIVSQTWFNLTQGTIITTPTSAQIASNLTLFNSTIGQSSYRSLARWWLNVGAFSISIGLPFAVIRNLTANPLRLVDFSLTGISNFYAVSNDSNVQAVAVNILSGVSAVTGGNVTNSTKCTSGTTYAADSNVTVTSAYTSVTVTNTYQIGVACIGMPFVGPSASETSSTGFSPQNIFGNTIINTIIPSGGGMSFTPVALGSQPTSQICNFAAQLTLDL